MVVVNVVCQDGERRSPQAQAIPEEVAASGAGAVMVERPARRST